MISPEPILIVTGLGKRFVLHQADKRLAPLQGVNLSARPGRLTALVGPSGSGKSSVLKCLYRTYLPTSGTIIFTANTGPVDLATADERLVIRLRQCEIGFVTQFLHVMPRQGAQRVVAAPLIALGRPEAEALAQAGVLLDRLELPARLWDLPPATFSGGEKQRVNLARALVVQPRLLLLDEPTASLDRHSAQLVVEAIKDALAAGTAVVAIFHDRALVAALADQVVELTADPGDEP